MRQFQYIYDDNGFTCFDNYFDYLQKIEDQLPKQIRDFFCNKNRYILNCSDTLHDAWIVNMSINNIYENNDVETSVVLDFLLASHVKNIRLEYKKVSNIFYKNIPTFWSNKAADLLCHEFLLNGGTYSHLIQFDKDVWLLIDFGDFSISEDI